MAVMCAFMRVVTPNISYALRKSVGDAVASRCQLSQCFPSFLLPSIQRIHIDSSSRQLAKPFPSPLPHQHTVIDTTSNDNLAIEGVINKVNSQINDKSHGRLFAVVHLVNKQVKITPEDVVVLEGYWPPNVGDIIRLEKVLLVGSSDFSLVGMPILRPDLVNIQATVIEKRLSHIKTNFKWIKRKHYRRINFYRYQQTMIRINSITLTSCLNEKKDVEGLEGRVF